jgi:hypothetical protein
VTSIHDFQPMQPPNRVARYDPARWHPGDAYDWSVGLQAGGLDPGGQVPQPDGPVIGARGEAAVRQQAERRDPTRVSLQTGGLGARRG